MLFIWEINKLNFLKIVSERSVVGKGEHWSRERVFLESKIGESGESAEIRRKSPWERLRNQFDFGDTTSVADNVCPIAVVCAVRPAAWGSAKEGKELGHDCGVIGRWKS